jgi:hypothetical protein
MKQLMVLVEVLMNVQLPQGGEGQQCFVPAPAAATTAVKE